MTLAERLDKFDLAEQMLRVVWTNAMQFIQQGLDDQLGRGVLHAVDHPVSRRPDRFDTILLSEPINQEFRRRFVTGDSDAVAVLVISGRVVERQIGATQADAINLSIRPSLYRFASLE